MLWAGVFAGESHLLNATGIGRDWPICAADFTAGSRRLIYECTGRAGPAWLKREREIWKYNCSLFISKYLHLLCTWKLEDWSTSIRGHKRIQIYVAIMFFMESFPFVISFLEGFITFQAVLATMALSVGVCFHGSWLCGRRLLIYNLAAFFSFKKW